MEGTGRGCSAVRRGDGSRTQVTWGGKAVVALPQTSGTALHTQAAPARTGDEVTAGPPDTPGLPLCAAALARGHCPVTGRRVRS